MKLTNVHGLPEPVVAAISNDSYDNQGSDLTVTQMISPPQMIELSRRHKAILTEDVGDRLWATYGQIIHGLLERTVTSNAAFAERYLSEERMFVEVNGWKVSGQFDLYDKQEGILYDYKFVGAYAIKMALSEGKREWEEQLNILRWLLWKSKGIVTKQVAIVGMVRDFSERVEKEGIRPVQVIPFPAWDMELAEQFAHERIALHQSARSLPDDRLPSCTDEERWLRKGVYGRCRRYCVAAPICSTNLNTRKEN